MHCLRNAILVVLTATAIGDSNQVAAQSCGVRNHFRIVTSMSGAPSGERRVDTGWLSAGPLVTSDTITTTNTYGCRSQGDCTATTDYGLLRCSGTGLANNVSGIGVFLWLDEWIGAEPKAHFRDELSVVSGTLPIGTPVQIRCALTLDGFAQVIDPVPGVSYRAQLSVGSAPSLVISNAAGAVTGIVNTQVGARLSVDGRLNVSLFARAIQGGSPMTSSYACDLVARVGFACLTPGATLLACSGRSYGTLSPDARVVGTGCGVTPPSLASNAPSLGQNLAFTMSGAAPLQAVVFGIAPGAATPTAIGTCTLYLDLPNAVLLTAGSTDSSGSWSFGLTVPAQPGLAGGVLTAQAIPLRPGGALLGFAESSNGVELTIGY
ncbi:MAG: hypothetical protein HZB39_17165 [Planctomycetes bacterium]|nr:hypothetical protein [Planctomycetota bacterium]